MLYWYGYAAIIYKVAKETIIKTSHNCIHRHSFQGRQATSHTWDESIHVLSLPGAQSENLKGSRWRVMVA